VCGAAGVVQPGHRLRDRARRPGIYMKR
jgi:hypothetical protein